MKKLFQLTPLFFLFFMTLACSPAAPEVTPARKHFTSAPEKTKPSASPVSPFNSSETVSTVQVFLVALEGGSNSGEEIGCGDRLVPITLMIEPAEDALRASLTHLLALEDREHGGSGLYNALHASELIVDRIRVDNGSAEIHFSGQLLAGGVCDSPRILGQLSATALQFDDISVARFFVNDLPLEEVLSGK